MTLTVGTNTYINQSDADTYFAESINNTAWTALSSTQKEQYLVTATRMIDRQTWAGDKTVSNQTLAWPRTSVVDRYGNAVNSAAVPLDIINAECELAFAISVDPSVLTVKNQSSNIKSVKAGPAEVTFMRPIIAGKFPQVVQELLGQYLTSSVNIATPTVSGDDQCSKFDPCNPWNNYDLLRGY